jgi:nicotinate-nucleotide pyrophosphorylase (carboxylating)
MEIPSGVVETIRRALEEDVGPGDCTTSLLIPEKKKSSAQFTAKEHLILAGLPFASLVFQLLDHTIRFRPFFADGDRIEKSRIIAEVSGYTSVLLKGERVSLNLLQRLSGIATLTALYVEKIKGLKAKIVDTRKTTPCLRSMEKYAVRTGGGCNHRFGLFDGILIKDNHINAVGSIPKAIERAKSSSHHLSKIEIEVENISGLREAIHAGADIVMLDNMSVADMRKAVKLSNGRVALEASGGITLENVREVAETGVDFISVGALTHSAPAVDISLKIVK